MNLIDPTLIYLKAPFATTAKTYQTKIGSIPTGQMPANEKMKRVEKLLI